MSKQKHMPGPWNEGVSIDGEKVIVDFVKIRKVPMRGSSIDDSIKASARLIAAAPEMLAMLKRLEKLSTLDAKLDRQLQKLIAEVEYE